MLVHSQHEVGEYAQSRVPGGVRERAPVNARDTAAAHLEHELGMFKAATELRLCFLYAREPVETRMIITPGAGARASPVTLAT